MVLLMSTKKERKQRAHTGIYTKGLIGRLTEQSIHQTNRSINTFIKMKQKLQSIKTCTEGERQSFPVRLYLKLFCTFTKFRPHGCLAYTCYLFPINILEKQKHIKTCLHVFLSSNSPPKILALTGRKRGFRTRTLPS